MNTKKKFEVTEVGVMAPNPTELDNLQAGDVGYIAASIKDIRSCHVGDTITDAKNVLTSYGYSCQQYNYTSARTEGSLRNGNPVYMRGGDVSSGIGHAWVCDGCDLQRCKSRKSVHRSVRLQQSDG